VVYSHTTNRHGNSDFWSSNVNFRGDGTRVTAHWFTLRATDEGELQSLIFTSFHWLLGVDDSGSIFHCDLLVETVGAPPTGVCSFSFFDLGLSEYLTTSSRCSYKIW